MSRTFARRLAAVALLAVLCLALPAAAAAPRHTAKAPATAPGLWDGILTWIGNFLGVPSPARAGRPDKATTILPLLPPGAVGPAACSDSDGNYGIDPNG